MSGYCMANRFMKYPGFLLRLSDRQLTAGHGIQGPLRITANEPIKSFPVNCPHYHNVSEELFDKVMDKRNGLAHHKV